MRGKYHKEGCRCRLCLGEAGFQKGHSTFISKETYKEIGRYEKQILDRLELLLGLKILAIEIDEPSHFDSNGNLKEKDIKRQKIIEGKLGCRFLRICLPKKVKISGLREIGK